MSFDSIGKTLTTVDHVGDLVCEVFLRYTLFRTELMFFHDGIDLVFRQKGEVLEIVLRVCIGSSEEELMVF